MGNEIISANKYNKAITCENQIELLGMILDSKLSIEDHINNIC